MSKRIRERKIEQKKEQKRNIRFAIGGTIVASVALPIIWQILTTKEVGGDSLCNVQSTAQIRGMNESELLRAIQQLNFGDNPRIESMSPDDSWMDCYDGLVNQIFSEGSLLDLIESIPTQWGSMRFNDDATFNFGISDNNAVFSGTLNLDRINSVGDTLLLDGFQVLIPPNSPTTAKALILKETLGHYISYNIYRAISQTYVEQSLAIPGSEWQVFADGLALLSLPVDAQELLILDGFVQPIYYDGWQLYPQELPTCEMLNTIHQLSMNGRILPGGIPTLLEDNWTGQNCSG